MNQFRITPSELKQIEISEYVASFLEQDKTAGAFERELVDKYNVYLKRHMSSGANAVISSVGDHIPLAMLRDLSVVGGGSVGGYLVGTMQSPDFFGPPIVSQGNVLAQAGAPVLTDLKGDINVPHIDVESSISGSMIEEMQPISAGSTTVGRYTLSPKCSRAFDVSSRRLYEQTEGLLLIVAGQVKKHGFNLVNGALEGSGASGEILGLKNDPKVTSTSAAALSWGDACDFVKTLTLRGLTAREMRWMLNPTDAATLRNRARVAGLDAMMINDLEQMAGVLVVETNAATAGTIYLGAFSYMLIGSWGGLALLVNPYTLMPTAMVRMMSEMFFDAAPMNPAAFLVGTSFS